MPDRPPSRSLLEAHAGDRLRVVAVLFDSLREKFAFVGIRPGTELRILRRTGDQIHLRLASGRNTSISNAEAGFVEVMRVASLTRGGSDETTIPGPTAA